MHPKDNGTGAICGSATTIWASDRRFDRSTIRRSNRSIRAFIASMCSAFVLFHQNTLLAGDLLATIFVSKLAWDVPLLAHRTERMQRITPHFTGAESSLASQLDGGRCQPTACDMRRMLSRYEKLVVSVQNCHGYRNPSLSPCVVRAF